MSKDDSSVSRRWFVSGVAVAGAGALLSRVAAQAQPTPAAPPPNTAPPTGAAPVAAPGKIKPQAALPSAPAEVSAAAVAPSVVLPALPYPEKALEPYISGTTVGFHYGKHHKGYVDKLNELTSGGDLAAKPLEEVIVAAAADSSKTAVFNNAAQIWNHTFYWQSMKPKGGGAPAGKLAEAVTRDFGGVDALKKQLADAATGQFGSGWAWLVLDAGKLAVVKTPNADNPMLRGQKPLLTIDVWEHAYYLDWQNRRKDYVQAFLDHLVNWEFAGANLG
jgi:Fe-Mn family superoxide dismutase